VLQFTCLGVDVTEICCVYSEEGSGSHLPIVTWRFRVGRRWQPVIGSTQTPLGPHNDFLRGMPGPLEPLRLLVFGTCSRLRGAYLFPHSHVNRCWRHTRYLPAGDTGRISIPFGIQGEARNTASSVCLLSYDGRCGVERVAIINCDGKACTHL
jgi:hypothetical protein